MHTNRPQGAGPGTHEEGRARPTGWRVRAQKKLLNKNTRPRVPRGRVCHISPQTKILKNLYGPAEPSPRLVFVNLDGLEGRRSCVQHAGTQTHKNQDTQGDAVPDEDAVRLRRHVLQEPANHQVAHHKRDQSSHNR